MLYRAKWRVWMGALAIVALTLSACGDGDGGTGGQAREVKTDVGVTTAPCPGSTQQNRGCIYLGILSDLTEGPFRALAVPITDGQKAFWKRVNDGNGIGGKYDVNVDKYTRDNKYNPQEHVAKFREIEPNVLALAQTLGTPTTLAALDLYKDAEVIGAPASWWSGWAFEDAILESGYNYCIESMNGLDWAAEQFGKPTAVMAVHYPGDYGGDSAAGVAKWAQTNGVTFTAGSQDVQTLPNAQAGNQDAAVQAILRAKPSVVVIATGPAEMAEIVGKSAAQGFTGKFLGSVPTWNPALLQSEAAPAIKALYNFVAPWGPWGSDTPAHQAMEQAAGATLPANDGYTFGWIWSYPLKAVLEKALQNGDLTRAGLLAATTQVTVDYEGALPARKFGGDPNETLVRESIIAKPDEAAPLGASVLKDFFVGSTAQTFQFTEPCAAAG
jgi:ABC-type branched-subunit amino acid transport system substrate-binding protein